MKTPAWSRREWLKSATAFGVAAAGASAFARRGRAEKGGRQAVLDVGQRKQLFLDDAVIESMSPGLFPVMNQPVKHPAGPVISLDKPWERRGGLSFGGDQGNVIYDEEQGIYRFWSMMVNEDWSRDWLAYAYSQDGLHWVKPQLGIVTYQGHDTNFLGPEGHWSQAGVLRDPTAEPKRRYKMVYYCSGKEGHPESVQGMCIAHSSDGIHWRRYPDRYQPIWSFHSDTSNNLVWDARHERYLFYLRLSTSLRRWFDPEPVYPPGARTRTAGWASSKDFLYWDAPKSKIDPDDKYVCFHADQRDPVFSRSFYTLSVTPYEGGYIGMSAVYHTPDAVGMRLPAGTDTGLARTEWLDKIDVQSLWGRDGLKFERVSRRPFIPNGPKGSVDDDLVYPVQSMIVREDLGEIWIYYQAFGGKHSFYQRGEPQKGQICLARLRLDGFVAVTGRGTLTTRPLTFEGNGLLINATGVDRYAGPGWGSVRVEIVSPQTGKPLSGFTKEDCQAFSGDAVRHRVRWRSAADLGSLEAGPIQLRFHLDRAKLFSFRFTDGASVHGVPRK
jgi:hypothetical protein